jgi:integrase
MIDVDHCGTRTPPSLAAEGVPVNVIARQLGHRSVATTSRYIDHIQPTQVIETMRGRRWTP